MKALVKSPLFWLVVIAAVWYFGRRTQRKLLIARIEERFGTMGGLQNKTTEELKQILYT